MKTKITIGILLTLLLTSIVMLALNIQQAKASGTIYIRADGSIDPPTAPIKTADNITYTITADINDSIVIQRNSIILNGSGHTIQRTTWEWESKGIALAERNNITIQQTTIKGFNYGIWLNYSSSNIIFGNNVRSNYYGILLSESSDNSISGNTIANNEYGANLYYSSNNSIGGNSIIANGGYGINLGSSSNHNNVSGNSITTNYDGVDLGWSSNYNTIIGNNIIDNNNAGIVLSWSSNHNSIIGNILTANKAYGISLGDWTSNNSISGNNIIDNGIGIFFYRSSNNSIYHNNIIDNNQQFSVSPPGYANVWDDRYPSGGNYWSDYMGIDELNGPHQSIGGSDGIGDTSYDIDENNTDRYPLMAPFSTFDAGVWNGETCSVDIISNSTLSDFKLNATQKTLSFNVTGIEGKAGFSRVTIPNVIVQDLWQGNFTVLLNGEPWPFGNWTDATNTYIYIDYTHSEHQIIIVPEFPSPIILPLFMVLAMLAVVFAKRKIPRKLET